MSVQVYHPFRDRAFCPPREEHITLGEIGGLLYHFDPDDVTDPIENQFAQRGGQYLASLTFQTFSQPRSLTKFFRNGVEGEIKSIFSLRPFSWMFSNPSNPLVRLQNFDVGNKRMDRSPEDPLNAWLGFIRSKVLTCVIGLRRAANRYLFLSPLHLFLRPEVKGGEEAIGEFHPSPWNRASSPQDYRGHVRPDTFSTITECRWHPSGILAVLSRSSYHFSSQNSAEDKLDDVKVHGQDNTKSSEENKLYRIALYKLVDLQQSSSTHPLGASTHMGGAGRGEECQPYNELDHAFQVDVRAMSWVPESMPILAVGCRGGILIWSTELNHADLLEGRDDYQRTEFIKETQGVCVFYAHPDAHARVSSLTFSPMGRYMAAGSVDSCRTLIFDISCPPCSKKTLVRDLHVLRDSTYAVAWSPHDHFLAQSLTHRGELFVYQTSTWAYGQYMFPHSVRHLRWINDSNSVTLLAGCQEEDDLYFFSFSSTDPTSGILKRILSFQPYIVRDRNHNQIRYVGANLSPTIREEEAHGGLVMVALSPSQQRLCIALKDGNIALLRRDIQATWSEYFSPVGFLRPHRGGNSKVGIRLMEFLKVEWGEILAVLWENNYISFVTCAFRHGA